MGKLTCIDPDQRLPYIQYRQTHGCTYVPLDEETAAVVAVPGSVLMRLFSCLTPALPPFFSSFTPAAAPCSCVCVDVVSR